MSRSCEEFGDSAGLTVRTVVADDRHANVHVHGELDLANADLFADVLEEHLAAGRRFVRLDLAGLGFVDCRGLSSLVQAHNRFLSEAGSLVLTGIGPRVRRLLSLTDLDQELLIAPAQTRAPVVPAPVGSSHINGAPLRAL
jgi:anti-sigma B factor antagonist